MSTAQPLHPRPRLRGLRRFAVVGGAVAALVGAAIPVAGAAETPSGGGLGYDPATDVGSLSLITRIVGAQAMWDAGYTGRGVDVAVIDTGVTPVPGLDAPGKVLDGPDLSFDSGEDAFAHLDTFGHGTHMASIIAGSDVAPDSAGDACATCLSASPYSDTTKFVGVAPEARIVNVKVGATDGSARVMPHRLKPSSSAFVFVRSEEKTTVDLLQTPRNRLRVTNVHYTRVRG